MDEKDILQPIQEEKIEEDNKEDEIKEDKGEPMQTRGVVTAENANCLQMSVVINGSTRT